MKLTFKPQLIPPFSKAVHQFDMIQVKPGDNLLSEAEFEILKNHPDFPRYDKAGCFEWEKTPSSPTGKSPKTAPLK